MTILIFYVHSLSSFDIDNITIRLGDHNLKRSHETRHAVRRVRRIVRNKTFNTSTLHGDIAIIQVTQVQLMSSLPW